MPDEKTNYWARNHELSGEKIKKEENVPDDEDTKNNTTAYLIVKKGD